MDAQDIRNLSEAYMNVYEEVDKRRAPKELVDRLNASREGHMAQDGPNKPAYDAKQRLLKKAQKRKNMEEQVDLYDIILSHLLDEGYAETPEAAEAIMVNMGEEWRQSIVEAVDDTHSGHPNYKGPSQDPLSRLSRTITRSVKFATGQQGAEVRAKQNGIPGNVFVKQSGPFSTKNVPTKGSFISDTEMKRRGQSTKPMGPIGQ
jgi:hypothetical protein